MRRRRTYPIGSLYQSLGIIALSIVIALEASQSTALEGFIAGLGEKRLLGSFLAGMLFTSVFTTAPAIVLLGELAQVNGVALVAVTGALGALTGDYLIFRFVRDRLSEDMAALLQQRKRRLKKILKLPTAQWMLAILGFLIVASPLPDELGIALLGIAQTRPRMFLILSLTANFLGIVVIGLTAKSIAS